MRRSFFILASMMIGNGLVQAQGPEFIPPFDVQLSGTPAPGHILLAPFNLAPASNWASCLLICDSAGNPIAYRPETYETTAPFSVSVVEDLNLQPSGNFTYLRRFQDLSISLRFLDDHLAITDTLLCDNGWEIDFHDVIELADGTRIRMCIEERIMDASSLLTNTNNPGSDSAEVLGNVIERIGPGGLIEWSWKSLDNYALSDVYSAWFTNATRLDHTHFNSIFIDDDGHYLLSARHLNEITKINSQTGAIIWRFGGKQNDFTLIGDTIPFVGQHDATRLPNGNILLFDNATHTVGGVARAIEYALDTTNMTATALWQKELASGFISPFMGNATRLDNGHTFINWGGAVQLDPNIALEEVDDQGDIVMSIDFPSQFVSYRAHKLDIPFALPRPEVDCFNQVLSAPDSADAYWWNTGDTTQSITLNDTGTYYVWTQEEEVWFRSDHVVIDDPALGCAPLGIAQPRTPGFRIYPNPGSDWIRVTFQSNRQPRDWELHDLTGRRLPVSPERLSGNSFQLNLAGIAPGVYLLTIDAHSERVVVQ